MLQYLRWAVNSALFVGCCFLTANIANSIFAAALTPNTTTSSEAAVSPASASRRSWRDREVILTRNLFNSSTLAQPVEAEILSEQLEATKLPLTLIGTAAATDELYSWAAIKDRDSSDTKIVRFPLPREPNHHLNASDSDNIALEWYLNPQQEGCSRGLQHYTAKKRRRSCRGHPREPPRRTRSRLAGRTLRPVSQFRNRVTGFSQPGSRHRFTYSLLRIETCSSDPTEAILGIP